MPQENGWPSRGSPAHRTIRALWVILGAISLILGIIGIFLPLLPTTPFILLAAACFARGSERFHTWMLSHPRFGPLVRDWQTYRAIPLRAKILALSMMWVSMGTTAWLLRERPLASLALVACALCVSIWMVRLPTRPVARHPSASRPAAPAAPAAPTAPSAHSAPSAPSAPSTPSAPATTASHDDSRA